MYRYANYLASKISHTLLKSFFWLLSKCPIEKILPDAHSVKHNLQLALPTPKIVLCLE